MQIVARYARVGCSVPPHPMAMRIARATTESATPCGGVSTCVDPNDPAERSGYMYRILRYYVSSLVIPLRRLAGCEGSGLAWFGLLYPGLVSACGAFAPFPSLRPPHWAPHNDPANLRVIAVCRPTPGGFPRAGVPRLFPPPPPPRASGIFRARECPPSLTRACMHASWAFSDTLACARGGRKNAGLKKKPREQ